MTSVRTPAPPASVLVESPPIPAIFKGRAVYDGFDATDLRETAKFHELPNVLGLAAHDLARPPGEAALHQIAGRLDAIPVSGGSALGLIRDALGDEPTILVRGLAAAGCSRPFRIAGFFPQRHAALAQAFEAMLWPDAADAPGSDFRILALPDAADAFLAYLPDLRFAVAMGTDDLRATLPAAIEAAHRTWIARTERHYASGGGPTSDVGGARWEEIRLLPGGSFPFREAPASPAFTLVYSGESLPDGWERYLQEHSPALARLATADLAPAQAEPWVAEGGGRLAPFWRAVPLPARALGAAPAWRIAAEHPDAIPFGARIDAEGRLDLEGSPEDAFVVVPREAIPAPFAGGAVESARVLPRVGAILTHHASKDDARELWARGFPMPRSIV